MSSTSGGTFSRSSVITRIGRVTDARLAQATGSAARLAIETITPAVDDGRFAVKRTAGETLEVEADIFGDGHGTIAAQLIIKHKDDADWRRVAMRPMGNDRWQARVPLHESGRHSFAIEAWLDIYGTFASDLGKKLQAGVETAIDIAEGRALISEAARAVTSAKHGALDAILKGLDLLTPREAVALLLAPETRVVMSAVSEPAWLIRSGVRDVDVDRKRAAFASWYELFPRSQTADVSRPGTFKDVVARLPAIAAMGFDVLYLPPIHPIGVTNRKGRNNALAAAPDDPGSPYAIGTAEGGHDAVHPALGSLADFRALIAAAQPLGIEIALDFAIQCSPDHPWLKAYPRWFDWRPDGTIKYAENPPKKYEDIVNVDFYSDTAKPALWIALRDVVLFWVEQGVAIFRVDNPHTKPFPFWQWLIADVRSRRPDVIFLAEAFTRPKVMYRLAKLGFSQSYTYFTWRNTKRELTDYMTELSRTNVREFFRPNFFVNTPDINPFFLQTGGRSAFLIRAALATTLSGLWGAYSGFELCESEALAGREEYRNSEKYEIKPRDWSKPGNIVAEIATLNRLRKNEPALQSHLGVTFYNAFNDNVLYYGKTAVGRGDRLLIMVNLDPHHTQECDFEIPLWEWGLPDHERLQVEDLIFGYRFVWQGKIQHVRLDPGTPYKIWRIQPVTQA